VRLVRTAFAPQLLLAIKRLTVVEIRNPAMATVVANPMASSMAYVVVSGCMEVDGFIRS
jgi:hypothetical protein